jgi:hypothetical protein
MPVNWQLGLNQGPDPITRVRSAFDEGFQRAGERKAAGALAQGNAQGALDAYARMGNTAGVERVNTQQQEAARRAQEGQRRGVIEERQDTEWDQKQQDYARQNVLRVAVGLRSTPQEQRTVAYQQQAVPLLQQLGVPDEVIQQGLADGVLSDQEIDAFIAQMGGDPSDFQPQYQPVQGQNGELGYFVRPQGAAPSYQTIRPGQADPFADLERQKMEAEIRAIEALEGQRRRSNPGGGRASGGGGGGGSGGAGPWSKY